METSKVLVVNDDPEVLDLMTVLGLEVRVARDGDEALKLFWAERPLRVITDLKIPGTDGLELMKAIKEASRGPKSSSSPRVPMSARRSRRFERAPSLICRSLSIRRRWVER